MVKTRYDNVKLCDDYLNDTRLFFWEGGIGSEVLATITSGDNGLNGGRSYTPATGAGNSAFAATQLSLKPSANYLMDIEVLVSLEDISASQYFFGFTDLNGANIDVEAVCDATATALSPAASDYAGILWNPAWTDGRLRHVWRGGSGAAQATTIRQATASVDPDQYAADFEIADGRWFTARVRVNAQGDAEFWVEGTTVKKDGRGDAEDEDVRNYWRVPGAVNPATQFAVNLVVENNAATAKAMYVDYAVLEFRRAVR